MDNISVQKYLKTPKQTNEINKKVIYGPLTAQTDYSRDTRPQYRNTSYLLKPNRQNGSANL